MAVESPMPTSGDRSQDMAKSSPSLHEPTEYSPLLSPSNERGNAFDQAQQKQPQKKAEKILLLMMVVVLLLSLGDQWMESPQTRILESVICYRYWEKVDPSKVLLGRDRVGPGAIGGVPESLCKDDAVQSELAMLRGWQQFFNGFPGLLLALPMGWVADNIGRKPIMTLGLIAITLQAFWIQVVTWFWQAFDIRVTWLSTLFGSLGGGNIVATTICFVVISDVTTQAARAAAFLRVGAFNLLAGLTMPPFAAWLMTFNPWIPTLGGTCLMVLSTVLFTFIPETLHYQHESISSTSHAQPPTAEVEATPSGVAPTSESKIRHLASHWLAKLKDATAFLTNDWRVPALILPFLCHMLLGANSQLFLQYLSKRYGLTLSKATLVMTIRNAVVVLLLFVILPYVSTGVMRVFRLSAQRKDLYLARASQVLLALGWTLVGLSPDIPYVAISLAISSLGNGAPLLLRSFLTSLVEAHHVARVLSIISILDTLGMMFGSPLLAGLFKQGLALGGAWIGLEFYFLGFVLAVFALLMFMVGLRKGEYEYTPVNDEDDNDDDEDEE